MKNKSILLSFFVLLSMWADAQYFDYVGAAQTYWKYRYRLVGDYIQSDSTPIAGEPGFLIRGEGAAGLSSPARNRTRDLWPANNADGQSSPFGTGGSCANQPNTYSLNLGGILSWTDGQGTDLGRYMAVLATEWKLLHDNNESTAKTELELYYALKAFNRLEEYAYTEFGDAGQENGLFNRDDVPASITGTTLYSPGLPVGTPYKNFGSLYNNVISYGSCTDWSCGNHTGSNPGLMSKDQAIRMLWGLAFVVHSLPSNIHGSDWGPYTVFDHSYDLRGEAQAALGRIITWMSDNPAVGGLPLGIWEIVDPNLGPVCLGEGAQGESFGLVTAGRNFAGWVQYPFPTRASNAYSAGPGMLTWDFIFELQLFFDNNLPIISTVSADYETELMIMDGPLPPTSLYSIIANAIDGLCFCNYGSRLETKHWAKGIYQEGLNINYPYFDLAAAYLWSYRPYGPQGLVKSNLTQRPIDATHPYSSIPSFSPFPCDMPLFDYNFWKHRHHLALNIPPGEQYNGLDYMLYYNLYSIHYGGTYQSGGSKYLDVAEAKMTAFSDLQDRVVTVTYPIDLNTVGIPHVPSYRYLGTSANPLYVGAETSMMFQGGLASSGAHVDFVAPHLGAPYNTAGAYASNASFWAKLGSVVTLNNGRPPCGSAIIPGTTTEYKSLPEDTVDETPYQYLIDSLVAAYQNGTLQYTDDSTLQDVSYTLNIYPNPFSSECKIDLTLPSSATVSMELYDTYGRDIFTVLSESQLGEGDHKYLIDREGLVTGTYMLVMYINNQRFVRKLTII